MKKTRFTETQIVKAIQEHEDNRLKGMYVNISLVHEAFKDAGVKKHRAGPERQLG